MLKHRATLLPEASSRRACRRTPTLRRPAGAGDGLLPAAAALLLALLPLGAQVPRMSARQGNGAPQPVPIDLASVSIRLVADVAETTLDLTFRNDGDRALEGEFVLPLPAGATVSDYALEVNGKLRAAVAVEKERARFAYESIKRQMIDPGLVEREAGNAYRTRVFPIPAHGTKRLRIGYVEQLARGREGLLYRLPLGFATPLAGFDCRIEAAPGSAPRLLDAAGLMFLASSDSLLAAEARDRTVEGCLRLVLPVPADPVLVTGEGGSPYFYFTDTFPGIPAKPRPKPAMVLLFWDASESRLGGDRAAEFGLLDAWFRLLGQTRVSLHLLRDTVAPGGEFEVRGGDWRELRKALTTACHDGATSFAGLSDADTPADLVLFFTDGQATFGKAPGLLTKPLIVVHSGPVDLAETLESAIRRTGGNSIDLDLETTDTALAKLQFEPFRVTEVLGDLRDAAFCDTRSAPGQPVRVCGRFGDGKDPRLVVGYGVGGETLVTRELTAAGARQRSPLARRLWAQRQLHALERSDRHDPESIVLHCREHALVSDHTSLIVLERMDDHVRYQIPPPEPELREEYQRLLALRKSPEPRPIDPLAGLWQRKLAWHARDFPWDDLSLLPRLRQVAIWKRAVERAFAPADLDAGAFGAIVAWHDQTRAVMERRRSLGNDAELAAWRQQIQRLVERGSHLGETPLATPPADKAWAVSVRGLVKTPGTIPGAKGLTLRQAIAKAGGLHPLGSLDHVELFRNAGKTVYNTLSERYRDIPLLPGDMIVVREKYFDRASAGMDPFAAAQDTPDDPAKQQAVRASADLWVDLPAPADPEPFGSRDPVPVPDSPAAKPAPDLAGGEFPDLGPLIADLVAGKDPRQAYESLVASRRLSAAAIVGTARVLTGSGQPGLACRALSTLVERRGGGPAALRAHALWLADLQQHGEALRVLDRFAPETADHRYPLAQLAASIHASAGDRFRAAQLLQPVLEERFPPGHPGSEPQAIALTDFSALHRLPTDPEVGLPPHPLGQGFQQNLDADLRILAFSSEEAPPRLVIEDPSGFWCRRESPLSPCGGSLTCANGVAEFMARHAMPGRYRISCGATPGATVRVIVFSAWGRPGQSAKLHTILCTGDGPEAVTDHEQRLVSANRR